MSGRNQAFAPHPEQRMRYRFARALATRINAPASDPSPVISGLLSRGSRPHFQDLAQDLASSLSDSGIQPGGNDRYVTGKRQTGRSSSGAEAILGLLEPAVGSAPGWASSQAGIRTNMRLMFHAMVTRLHSPRTFSRPRIENCRKPITDLMMPNTGSGVCLRNA